MPLSDFDEAQNASDNFESVVCRGKVVKVSLTDRKITIIIWKANALCNFAFVCKGKVGKIYFRDGKILIPFLFSTEPSSTTSSSTGITPKKTFYFNKLKTFCQYHFQNLLRNIIENEIYEMAKRFNWTGFVTFLFCTRNGFEINNRTYVGALGKPHFCGYKPLTKRVGSRNFKLQAEVSPWF